MKFAERSLIDHFTLICAGLITAVFAVFIIASSAHAGGVNLSIGLLLPFPGYVVPPPAVAVPAPVVVATPPVVVYEQPVVIGPYPHGHYYRPLPPGLAKKYYKHHRAHWWKE